MASPEQERSTWWTERRRLSGRAARPLLNVAVALAILGLVIWRANPWQLAHEYSDFDPWPAVAAALLNIPILLLLTMRGRFILSRLGHAVPFLALFPISTLGNVAGSLTPAAAGELLRAPLFKERHDIPYWDGLAAIVYERGLSMLMLAVSTGVAAAWSTLGAFPALAVTVAACASTLAAPSVAAFVLARLRPVAGEESGHGAASLLRRLRATLGRSVDSLLVLLGDLEATIVIGVANAVVFAIMAAQLWLVVGALGLHLSLAEAWTALGASSLVAIVTFLPLGLGTFDATLAALIGATQNGFHAGAAAAVLLRATSTLPLGAVALLCYLYLAGARRRSQAASTQVPT